VDWIRESDSYNLLELPQDLGGAIVVVGTTAAGLSNPVPTSRGAVYPHEAQAVVLSTMISNTNIQRPDWADGAEILAIAVAGVVLLFLTRWTYAGLATVIILCAAGIVGSRYAFGNHLWLFDATALVGSTILVALHAYGIKFVSEFLQKQQIKKQFGTYLSPAMVEKLQKNPKLLTLGGDSRELSIMFTDVRGFTSISEHYGADVQGLTKIMNRYMTAMTAKIIQNEGTLDKYIGDAQMAFWNAPLDDADHAKHAVKTALEMLGDLERFNSEIAAEGVPPFGMGLGINTGSVVVGNMGSSQRFDYTCLGDSVNLASRLEGQSKPYHVKLIIGPKTYEYVKNDYNCVELDCIAVKGKTEGVNIYTIVPPGSVKTPNMTTHQYFLQYYREGKWDEAISYANILKRAFDGELTDYYESMVERIEEYKINPPANWDGVYRTNTK
jgi:adenylate cyclase